MLAFVSFISWSFLALKVYPKYLTFLKIGIPATSLRSLRHVGPAKICDFFLWISSPNFLSYSIPAITALALSRDVVR